MARPCPAGRSRRRADRCSRSSASRRRGRRQVDSAAVAELIGDDPTQAGAAPIPGPSSSSVLGWEARHVAGAPGGPPLPDELLMSRCRSTTRRSRPTWAVSELGDGEQPLAAAGAHRGAGRRSRCARRARRLGGDAAPALRAAAARDRRLRRRADVERTQDEDRPAELRLIYAPRGETSGWLTFPLRALGDRRRPADARRPQAAARLASACSPMPTTAACRRC